MPRHLAGLKWLLVTDHLAIGSSIRLDQMVTAIRGRERDPIGC